MSYGLRVASCEKPRELGVGKTCRGLRVARI